MCRSWQRSILNYKCSFSLGCRSSTSREGAGFWITERPPFPSSLQNRHAQLRFPLGVTFQWLHLQVFSFPHMWPPPALQHVGGSYSLWSESRRSSLFSAAFRSVRLCTDAGSFGSALHQTQNLFSTAGGAVVHLRAFPQTATSVKEETRVYWVRGDSRSLPGLAFRVGEGVARRHWAVTSPLVSTPCCCSCARRRALSFFSSSTCRTNLPLVLVSAGLSTTIWAFILAGNDIITSKKLLQKATFCS